ncbi:hypothetical protein DNK10_03870 [Pseudomonas daroniae]|nr:hypothetical protein DNK10_03870 [Pseudomonas daroniae]
MRADLDSIQLFDAASNRHQLALDVLSLLAGADDLGSPATTNLAGTFDAMRLLLDDAAALYAAAYDHQRGLEAKKALPSD